MNVRGAPAIAIAAALGLAVEATSKTCASDTEAKAWLKVLLLYISLAFCISVHFFFPLCAHGDTYMVDLCMHKSTPSIPAYVAEALTAGCIVCAHVAGSAGVPEDQQAHSGEPLQ